MIHQVMGGIQGSHHEIALEYKEMAKTQKRYISCLAKETKMTVQYIKNLLDQRRDVYMTAREAKKLGIADKII